MGDFADTFSFRAAGKAREAAKAADSNLNARLTLLQMVNNMDTAIHEMRDWETKRFNDMIDTMRQLNGQIQE